MSGTAIDFNVWHTSTGTRQLCNSACMQLVRSNPSAAPRDVRCFLDRVNAHSVLRWGGMFNTPDPVHIDDFLNRNTATWDQVAQACKRAYDSGCYATRAVRDCRASRAALHSPPHAQTYTDDNANLGGACTLPGGARGTCMLMGDCMAPGDIMQSGLCPGSRLVRCCVKSSLPWLAPFSVAEAGEAVEGQQEEAVEEVVPDAPLRWLPGEKPLASMPELAVPFEP